MKLAFFTVPVFHPQVAQDELNGFLASHRIVALDKNFVPDGGASSWAVCVGYLEGNAAAATAGRGGRVDYRQVLSEGDFIVYAELRSLRKEIADRDGLPAYALFTNEQLAEMVTRRAASEAALGDIPGIGKARLEKYGREFLAVLSRAFGPERVAPE